MELRISNVWENFNLFEYFIRESGSVEDKKTLRKIKETHFDGEVFIGDWDVLFKFIVNVCKNSKRVLNQFGYTKDERDRILKFFLKNDITLRTEINKILKTNSYNGVVWGSGTPFYKTEDKLYLNTKTEAFVVGYRNLVVEGHNDFELNSDTFEYILTFKDGEFVDCVTKENGEVVEINYPEVIRFIKTKYFGFQYTQPINYKNFRYLLLCLSNIKPFLSVPIINDKGRLSSVGGLSTPLYNEKDVREYLKKTDNLNVTNTIDVKFEQIAFNKFVIHREGDDAIEKAISDIENEYGDKRARFPLSPKSINR